MSAFQEQLLQDLDDVFLNTEEFGELHTVNGSVMRLVVDNDELEYLKARAGYADYIHAARMMIYVKASEFGARPVPDALIDIDKRKYRVISASGDMLYQIVLGANRG